VPDFRLRIVARITSKYFFQNGTAILDERLNDCEANPNVGERREVVRAAPRQTASALGNTRRGATIGLRA